mmetsp:Transcript_8249/g.12220  ORF Transcript_8249/g.12220 Transcript_8249/m.12220 type:complete len:294 (-) Transcript_8249:2914-3795(-)
MSPHKLRGCRVRFQILSFRGHLVGVWWRGRWRRGCRRFRKSGGAHDSFRQRGDRQDIEVCCWHIVSSVVHPYVAHVLKNANVGLDLVVAERANSKNLAWISDVRPHRDVRRLHPGKHADLIVPWSLSRVNESKVPVNMCKLLCEVGMRGVTARRVLHCANNSRRCHMLNVNTHTLLWCTVHNNEDAVHAYQREKHPGAHARAPIETGLGGIQAEVENARLLEICPSIGTYGLLVQLNWTPVRHPVHQLVLRVSGRVPLRKRVLQLKHGIRGTLEKHVIRILHNRRLPTTVGKR